MRIARINIAQNSTDPDPVELELINPLIRKVHKKNGHTTVYPSLLLNWKIKQVPELTWHQLLLRSRQYWRL
jgi:hypothetical protein